MIENGVDDAGAVEANHTVATPRRDALEVALVRVRPCRLVLAPILPLRGRAHLALANAVRLLVWGIGVARKSGRSWPVALVTGAVDAAFWAFIIGLKARLH